MMGTSDGKGKCEFPQGKWSNGNKQAWGHWCHWCNGNVKEKQGREIRPAWKKRMRACPQRSRVTWGRGWGWEEKRNKFQSKSSKAESPEVWSPVQTAGLILEGREVGGTHGTGEQLECLQALRRHWWPFSINLCVWFAFEWLPYGNYESCKETVDDSNTRASSLIHNSEIWNGMKSISFLLTW